MKTILFILLFISALFAGDIDRITQQKFLFPQMTAIGSYNSLGFSNMFSGPASQISAGNPADLSGFNNPAVGIRFDYPTEIKLYDDIKLGWRKSYIPSSFAIVYPISDFRIGLGYYLKYAHFIDFGKIELKTVEEPEGTGEYFSSTDETAIYNFSLPAAYTMKGLFGKEDLLSLGVQFSLDYIYGREEILITKGKVDALQGNWKAGISYWFNQRIGISAFYDHETNVKTEMKISSKFYVAEPDSSSGYDDFTSDKVKVRYRLPGVLAFGLISKPLDDISISITASSVLWKSIDKRYQNNLDLSVNIIYSIFPFLDISLGVYKTDMALEKDYSYSYQYNATYFSPAVRARLGNFTGYLVVSDSHWYSARKSKQTRISAGVDYTL